MLLGEKRKLILLSMLTLGQGLRKIVSFICNFLVKLDLGALILTLTRLYQ
jgi:hypothetical protein